MGQAISYPNASSDLIPLTLSNRTHHSMPFQTPTAGTDIYKVACSDTS